MADKVSATISYVDANNRKGMKAVTDINPNADNGAVKNFCTGLNALTTNTLTGVEKIERTDITNATTKPKLTLTMPQAFSLNLTSLSTAANPDYELFNQSNLPNFVYRIDEPIDFYNSRIAITVYRANIGGMYTVRIVTLLQSVPSDEGTVTVTVYFEETETTAATTAVITIPITGKATLEIL